MSKEVYDYVIDSINTKLNNGIEYYKDNEELKAKLVDIYDYINNQQEEYVQVEVFPEDEQKTDNNEETAKEIKGLIKSFLNKQSRIKADALNLERSIPNYELPPQEVEEEKEPESIDDIPQSLKKETVVAKDADSDDINIVKKLVSDEKDYEQYHKDSNNDVSFDTTFDFDDIVTEIKEKTGKPVEVEPLEEEDELVIEKPKKRSILDLFKKS